MVVVTKLNTTTRRATLSLLFPLLSAYEAGSCYENQYNYLPGDASIVISNTFCMQGPVVVIKTNTTTPRLTLSQRFTSVLGWVVG